MKIQSFATFLLGCLISFINPVFAAEVSFSFNSTPRWAIPGSIDKAKTMAVSNGLIYLSSPSYGDIPYIGSDVKHLIDSDGRWPNFNSGYDAGTIGFGMDNDDAGNIVIKSGNGYKESAIQLTVYPAGATSATNKTEISLENALPDGRSDYMCVQGNVLSGKGYVWFVPSNTDKIVRVNIVDGVAISKTEWTHTTGLSGSMSLAYMLDDGSIYFHNSVAGRRGCYILKAPVDGGAATISKTLIASGEGGAMTIPSTTFSLLGNLFHIACSSSTVGDISFDIKNTTTGVTLASNITPFNDVPISSPPTIGVSTISSVGTIFQAIKVDDLTCDIYCYSPGYGASCYRVSATIDIESMNAPTAIKGGANSIILSWDKPSTESPSKYLIRYSSDNGVSWSEAIETTNLTYTFSDLPSGSYIFKVVPYYEQYSYFGAGVISNSVELEMNSVGAPIYNLIATYTLNDDASQDYYGRQDITLTWDAPVGMVGTSVSGYQIYRNGIHLATIAADELTYTNIGVTQNYTYKVVPLFEGLDEDASFGMEVTTTEVTTVLVAPIITEIRNYTGYSLTQLFFSMPNYSQTTPTSFNIYRDGILMQESVTQYNFIDNEINPEEAKTYTYTVEAVYSKNDNDTRLSAPKSVDVEARDWSLTGYSLNEIYNVPITSITGNTPNLFTNYEYYRQGHFYNGKWHIAQRADNLAKNDDPSYTDADKATDIESGIEGTTGGVVSIAATSENDIKNGFSATKDITTTPFASVGLAIDDKGNIFIRHNNESNSDMSTTAPAVDAITGLPTVWPTYIKDGYTRRITKGAIYQRDADNGTYASTPLIIDLNPLWNDNDWINKMVCSYSAKDKNGNIIGDDKGIVTGRSDYYHMYGDVYSEAGAYLLISPSWTRSIFKVHIDKNGYKSHEVLEFSDYSDVNPTTGKTETHKVSTGTENYGFKIAGRDTWMAQIRSNGYFGVHDNEKNANGEKLWHAIYDVASRINNAGGTSIVAFNSAQDKTDGETFLITPACMYSRNQGDFVVTRGIKNKTDEDASLSLLSPPMPVAQWSQTDINTNIATNANGNWFHAQKGNYINASGKDAECVDIYQYVPGVRFAKYRLIPENDYPSTTPTLDIATAYSPDGTDITHFSGTATWTRPSRFGIVDKENASMWIESYTFQLLNAKGEVIVTDIIPETYDNTGNPTMSYSFDYKNSDLTSQTYAARVAVNYMTRNGNAVQSKFGYARDINDYFAEPAEELSVHVFKQNNAEVKEWAEIDGQWVIANNTKDNYRIELDFMPPSWDGYDKTDVEPVSFYTIFAARTINNEVIDTIPVVNFQLHNGAEVINGVTRAKSTTENQIPGTYNFENNKAPFYSTGKWEGSESHKNTVLTWHHLVDNGTYNESGITTRSSKFDEPDKWKYIVAANYAGSNRYITKTVSEYISPNPEDGLIETGVEDISADNSSSLQIYPIPASASISVKSSVAIKSIVIYNEKGAEELSLKCNDETILDINIESLATGIYFVKVNNNSPIKIIKK